MLGQLDQEMLPLATKPKKKILFMSEQFCDALPERGLTNSYHNIYLSLKHCNYTNIDFKILHFDASKLYFNTHVDEILPNVCATYKPDAIIICLLCRYDGNPSDACLKRMKDEHKLKLSFIWPDTGPDYTIPLINQIGDLADLHVSWDIPGEKPQRDNHLCLWTPEDSKLYSPRTVRPIPAAFIGSPRYRDRMEALQWAIQNGAPIMVRGGQREEKLSPEQYARLLGRSKISINFSACAGAGFHQFKGRVLETLASGAMLLETKNDVTAKLLKPGYDYVEFDNPPDMVQKIQYYLTHEEERAKIAEQGYKTFMAKYTAKHYWDIVFGKLGLMN